MYIIKGLSNGITRERFFFLLLYFSNILCIPRYHYHFQNLSYKIKRIVILLLFLFLSFQLIYTPRCTSSVVLYLSNRSMSCSPTGFKSCANINRTTVSNAYFHRPCNILSEMMIDCAQCSRRKNRYCSRVLSLNIKCWYLYYTSYWNDSRKRAKTLGTRVAGR